MSNIYLTNKQYIGLLQSARKNLKTIQKANGDDCNVRGCKSTDTNVGLCNDNLCTKEIALFPDNFPSRKSIKYREDWHKCPLDPRSFHELKSNGGNGCFHKCKFFKNKLRDLTEIKRLYNECIVEAELLFEEDK